MTRQWPPVVTILAGVYASVWGAILAFAGVVILKAGVSSGLLPSTAAALFVGAIIVLPGVLMIVSGLWMIWQARWAVVLAFLSTFIAALVSLTLGNQLDFLVSGGLVIVLLLSQLRF